MHTVFKVHSNRDKSIVFIGITSVELWKKLEKFKVSSILDITLRDWRNHDKDFLRIDLLDSFDSRREAEGFERKYLRELPRDLTIFYGKNRRYKHRLSIRDQVSLAIREELPRIDPNVLFRGRPIREYFGDNNND